MTELESIKSNIQTQDHENGSSENVTVNGIPTIQEENQDTTTGNVRMDDEAPAMENIQTISDDSPDTNTEGAPVDSQEEGAGSNPIQIRKSTLNHLLHRYHKVGGLFPNPPKPLRHLEPYVKCLKVFPTLTIKQSSLRRSF